MRMLEFSSQTDKRTVCVIALTFSQIVVKTRKVVTGAEPDIVIDFTVHFKERPVTKGMRGILLEQNPVLGRNVPFARHMKVKAVGPQKGMQQSPLGERPLKKRPFISNFLHKANQGMNLISQIHRKNMGRFLDIGSA